ncbi:DUF3021 domain-containing protein [Virgibacillus sp. LDC1]|jgi:hypothetical protein|uniref:DUF3021 domain-containing protein n=1 Tax=Paenibacillus TaxID=44249 RepID=UPI000C27EB27|nr:MULTISPECIES: DUF3021 domain-containing protein [Paenibacillus]MCV4231254.1 DUF3021 domain-containing protein [Virgibacillus sp. LDC1]MEC0256835.1 DUF3021 domain-containing protein [Paenibacillus lautus]PJN55146.1 hypothetical protein PAEVO_18670 [Paenibacillus sp. GM2FR]
MNAFFFRSLIGIFFGAFIAVMTTSALIYFGGQSTIDGLSFIKNAFGYIFCGWLFTVTPLYFEIRSLALPMQTALHFLTVTIVYFILSLWAGWIPFAVKNFLLYLAISIFVYAIGWIGFYLYFKKESKKLNNDLRRH